MVQSVTYKITEIGYGRVVDNGDHDRQQADEDGHPEGAGAENVVFRHCSDGRKRFSLLRLFFPPAKSVTGKYTRSANTCGSSQHGPRRIVDRRTMDERTVCTN